MIYHYIFYTRTKPDGRVYVGCTREKKVEYRWIGKYSFSTIDTIDEVVFECDCSAHDADIIEAYFIMKYNAVRRGLNKNYGYAMNHWYVKPSCYHTWTEYIEENYEKVYRRLEDWVRTQNYVT